MIEMSGPALREARQALGMKVEELAVAFGITVGTVYRHENAREVPRWVRLAIKGLEAEKKERLPAEI
jgi:DNA-binding transcriptional regulator YiaG